jgi:hydroxymethylpyrimidine/phosphomethylpyrimidine kinase
MKSALTVGGFDPDGGAGINLDIKVFESLGVNALSAIASITVQSTLGVKRVIPLSNEILKEEIEEILSDVNVKTVKAGVLYTKDNFCTLAEIAKEWNLDVIVDPVMNPKRGVKLISDEGIEGLRECLLSKSYLTTPNALEASYLSGIEVKDINDAEKAAKEILTKFKVKNVLVKGGHIEGDKVTDLLVSEGKVYKFIHGRLSLEVHGSGDTLSASITAEIAKGSELVDAVEKAITFTETSLKDSRKVGRGYSISDPIKSILREKEKYRVIMDMITKSFEIEAMGKQLQKVIPEVQSNIAFSLPIDYVNGFEEIAVFPGRICKYFDSVKINGPPIFGKPTHTARLLLSSIKSGGNYRVVMNIRYDEYFIKRLKETGIDVVEIDRTKEPKDFSEREGKSMEWVIREATSVNNGKVPQAIADRGTIGKEAMIRIFAHSLEELMSILKVLTD